MPIQKAKNLADYKRNYQLSITKPEEFWAEEAKRLSWFKNFTKVKSTNFDLKDHHVRWFEDGSLNISYNCLDRHLEKRANKPAIIWQGDELNDSKIITYAELHKEVCKFSNALKTLGVKKGDTIIIYLPMIPEAAIAMLACTRIGAIHSVVFAGFSAHALADRILDCKPKIVITADKSKRGGKVTNLMDNVTTALKQSNTEHVIVVNNYNSKLGSFLSYRELVSKESDSCPAEEMNSEDPSFILYTSGSTGKPKGVVHSSAGYLLYASMTHEHAFDLEEDDIYWATADIGWITGHSYIVYGPLANGSTTLMFEGTPTYPEVDRYWQIIEQYKVSIFYTTPTALRSLIRYGDDFVLKKDLSSLRVLGSVGEPIDPETWQWFYDIVGKSKCHISDTWWQTETGGFAIVPLPHTAKLKPGSASFPFYGIMPEILKNQALTIKEAWPGMIRNVHGNHQRLLDTYFTDFPNHYNTGDGAFQDEDGYYWITGRMDDVLKVSGHRLSTAEIESALKESGEVAETAVVGFPHEIKGEGIYAYVILKNEFKPNDELERKLIKTVRESIGPIATIDKIQWVEQLPKTRSGKVMRRILRKISAGEVNNFGDLSTINNPESVDILIQGRK